MRLAGGTRRLFLLVALVALSSVVYSEARTKQVSAAGSSPVVIAVDATPASGCQVTYHLNVGWHGTPPRGATPLTPKSITIPCPAGTVIRLVKVSLAQAVAEHERYAPLPVNSQRPTAAEQAAMQTIIDARHQALAAQAGAVAPTTACGATNYASAFWTAGGVPNGTGMFSQIYWYKTYDCSQVWLDEAYLTAQSYSPYDPTWGPYWAWMGDDYYNDSWSVPNNPVLPPNTQETYYPDRYEPPQHWYRQEVMQWPCNCWFEEYVAVLN